MMTKNQLNKQLTLINHSLFAAKADNTLTLIYEKELKAAIKLVFQKMQEEIIANLKEHYNPDLMLKAHMDMILAPIHEYHKQYYDVIMKYKLREHKKGYVQGKRLVERAKQYAKNYSKSYVKQNGALKADSFNVPMKQLIKKDELFATSDYSAEKMANKTFTASQNTLDRVDKDINQIITDGYRDGHGINDVTKRINKRFGQLKDWEAQRIARTEIHGSHMQGIMKSYEEMGVEYTQWASAHDTRVRGLNPKDKADHVKMDGEIIPWNGTYSNGLKYPGDTSGRIAEWINCRCGNIPYFIPPGYAAPSGMSNFRESDLVPTLDKWKNDELISQFNKELVNDSIDLLPEQALSAEDWEYVNGFRVKLKRYVKYNRPVSHYDEYIRPHFIKNVERELSGVDIPNNKDKLQLEALKREYPEYYKKLVDEIDNVNKPIDYNRLTPQEREHYFKIKHNHDILKDAIENQNYSKLDEMEDMGGWYGVRDKKSFMEFTDNGRDLDTWVKSELEDYAEDMADYEKIIRDTNIYVDVEPRGIRWKNPELQSEYSAYNPLTKEYEEFNTDEKFIRYYFKKENLIITESVDMDTSRVRGLYQKYKELPKILQNTDEIVLSSQDPRIHGIYSDFQLGGYVSVGEGNRIVQFKKPLFSAVDTLVHESTHNLEKDLGFYISNSKEYVRAFYKDQKRLRIQGYSLDETYVTQYARDFTENALKGTGADRFRAYSEDFAESVKIYIKSPKEFEKMYPEKTKVIKKVLNGEFKPKTTTSYTDWVHAETGKYSLTKKESSRFIDLKNKQIDLSIEGKPLSKAERKELQFLEDKSSFNYLRNNMISGKITPDEEKMYWQLHDKLKDDLKLDSILNELEEIPPKVKMRNEILASKKDAFALTKQEKDILADLDSKKKEGKLGFRDRSVYTKLKEREYYNELRNKVIDRSAMVDDQFDWDLLQELHGKYKDWKPLSSIKSTKINLKVKPRNFKSPSGLHLSKKEDDLYSILDSNSKILSPKEREVYNELKDRKYFAKLHEKMLDEDYFEHHYELPGLDMNESQEYFELYLKYKSKWKLPDIDPKDILFDVDVNKEENYKHLLPKEYIRQDISALTTDEYSELKGLFIKKYHLKNITPTETERLNFLKAKRDFNEYYSVRIQDKGLSYKAEKNYYKCYKELTDKGFFDDWSIDDLIKLESSPWDTYTPGITPWKAVKSSEYTKFSGCFPDGMHPDIPNLEDLFTSDSLKFSTFEKDMCFDWLGADYRSYRTFLVDCDGDVKKYAQFLVDNARYNSLEAALEPAREVAYNSVRLINILNNELKKPITLWRCETKLHLGDNPQIGDIVTFEGFNSTAITKEGMKYFEETSKKTITAVIEIEAPAGTRGAYLAPISPAKFKQEMEFLLQKDTKVEIIKLGTKEGYDYAKVRIINDYEFDEVFNSRNTNIKLG